MNKLISVGRAAQILGVTRQYIYSLIESGELSAQKISRSYVLYANDVLKLAEQRVKEAEQEFKDRQSLLREAEEKLARDEDKMSLPTPTATLAAA